MTYRANRTAPRVLLVAGAVLLAGMIVSSCSAQSMSVDGEERTFTVNADELVVDYDDSAITLLPDDSLSGEIHVTRWFTASGLTGRAEVDWNFSDDGTLVLRTTCTGLLARCEAHHEIAVPADLPVRAEGDNGDVRAEGFVAGVDITTHNGAIEVSGTEGPLTLRSHNGGVTATGITSDEVRASTHNGAIEVAVTNAPSLIETSTHNGSTRVEVPGDTSYRVEGETRNGDLDLGVDASGDSHLISVRSHNGGITVAPAAG
ncbi:MULTISPECIES: DUF4097 family beta strand repeat-containing protein [unclassified Streptomyces]|uniref:DUF4097 family beta strand repeat-containing protein n=1 Tax=unclassified Streptomyces TaxID=2593676 RepID=UPI000CD58802|nr:MULTISPECIES: DUF4097 family beta strand repeat-containing protein [unclassified Streptomyces]